MTHWKQVRLVASWEFRRYFKWKDQLIGLLIVLGLGGLSYGVGKLAAGGRRPVTIATSGFELPDALDRRLKFTTAPADSAERARQLDEGDLGGVLTRRVDGSFDLFVKQDPRYLPELRGILTDLVRRERLELSGMSIAQLEAILAAPDVSVRFADPDRQRAGVAERVIASLVLGLVIMSVFTSMAYLLTGITGEKQLRVTESITAIIPPQSWIDGKILGIGAYSMATIANMVLGGVLIAAAAKLAWRFSIPPVIVRPGVIALVVLFSALAVAMWNAAFAAFASTIDDPNTSTRTSVMFLPFIPMAMTVSVMRDPDHLASRVLSLFPLTSPSAMPVRLILSNPGPVEIIVAISLLVATVWLFRRLAGRIFEIGMLMYGKEPTLREMWRWARDGGGRRTTEVG
jgi:ABC-2 type transport system permease protein